MTLSFEQLTLLPDPPLKTSPANFAQRADAFLDSLPDFVTEINTVITDLNKITSGLDQAEPIAAYSATTTYNFPDVVAGADGYSYRCIGVAVIGDNPVGSSSGDWVNLRPASMPVGSVIAFIGGYFTNGANSGFTNVIGNTGATINSLVNADGWYVCNGAALNLAGSPIFNGAGRYLPNLTDNRFLMGSTGAGVIGGQSSNDHSHTTGNFTLTNNESPWHQHTVDTYNGGGSAAVAVQHQPGPGAYMGQIATGASGGGAAHNHGTTSAMSAGTTVDNRPLFLSCHYIMKVI